MQRRSHSVSVDYLADASLPPMSLAGQRSSQAGSETGEGPRPQTALSIDVIADAALQSLQASPSPAAVQCDICSRPIEGEPFGRGLYIWTRGDERRFEEPALCARCSITIGVQALAAWSVEEEEG